MLRVIGIFSFLMLNTALAFMGIRISLKRRDEEGMRREGLEAEEDGAVPRGESTSPPTVTDLPPGGVKLMGGSGIEHGFDLMMEDPRGGIILGDVMCGRELDEDHLLRFVTKLYDVGRGRENEEVRGILIVRDAGEAVRRLAEEARGDRRRVPRRVTWFIGERKFKVNKNRS